MAAPAGGGAGGADVLRAGLNLMLRLPPKDVHTNLSGLTVLHPEFTEEFLQRVDQPLKAMVDPSTKRKFLLCDYNRDGDSYRSPWSNTYLPPIPESEGSGFVPPPALRTMEVQANEIFDVYRELYYEAGSSISSVYMWDLAAGFASCWLIKKEIGDTRFVKKGCWDAIHVIQVAPTPDGKSATFKLTSTVMLTLIVDKADTVGTCDLSGSLTRRATATHAITPDKGYIAICGGMIEAMEGDMRTAMDALYIAKTKEVVSALHTRSTTVAATSKGFVADLAAAVKRHGALSTS